MDNPVKATEYKYVAIRSGDGDLVSNTLRALSNANRPVRAIVWNLRGGEAITETLDGKFSIEGMSEEFRKIASANAYILNGITFQIARGGKVRILFQEGEPRRIHVEIMNYQDQTLIDFLPLIVSLQNELHPVSNSLLVEREFGKAAAERIDLADHTIKELISLSNNFNTNIVQARAQLDAENEKIRASMRAELDIERQKNAAEHEAQLQLIKQEWDELEKRQQEVNDKESKYERREIFSKQMARLEERITKGFFSPAAESRSKWVIMAFSGFIAAAGLWSLWSFWELAGLEKSELWYAFFAKSLLSGAVFFGSAAYFIKWLNGWYHRNLDEESRVHKQRLDLARQNLLTETLLEYIGTTEAAPPQYLLERFSRNLFEHNDSNANNVKTPVEYAAEMLMAAKGVKVSTPWGEAELAGSKLNEVAKAGANK